MPDRRAYKRNSRFWVSLKDPRDFRNKLERYEYEVLQMEFDFKIKKRKCRQFIRLVTCLTYFGQI